jgi:predicted TIM-barrel fold metal-dependent hydrolase
MFDAMRELDPAVRRGIVDLDETGATDAELADWHRLGVRGIRVNVSPVRPPEAGLASAMLPRIARLTAICRELRWHLDFLTPGWLVSELMPTLRELPIEFSVAHFGLFPAKDGVQQRGFGILALVGDAPAAASWLTGSGRFGARFTDVAPFAQARSRGAAAGSGAATFRICRSTIGSAPFRYTTSSAAGARRNPQLILADNPARLFGFS